MTHETPTGSDLLATGHWPASDKAITLGLMVPISEKAAFGETPRFEDIVAIGLAAREAGFDALWFADHFAMGHGTEDDPFRGVWECWTLMAAVAARVPDLQIGSLVACTGYRNPGVIAKMTEMIDEISGGRFILGLGAGWHKPEYDQYGFPFDHRVSRFEDAIAIIHPLLRQGMANYQGEFFQANEALNVPRGPRPAGAPILVGSSGPRMLDLIARYADAWNNGWHSDTARTKEQLVALDAACEAAGRDPKTLVRTAGANLAREDYLGARPNPVPFDDAAQVALIHEFRDLGFAHFICGLDPATPESVAAFAPVIEQVHAG
ncbi:MAG TPA: LLM class flavin-dependent oxidoreductase [Thermomicrobiales bacterium]|nr:LLM class flavin-dependent oxidoreductase [Thermomicrobiales bacterium]